MYKQNFIGHSYTHLFIYCLCYFHVTNTELNNYDIECMACKVQNIFYLFLYLSLQYI